MGLSGPPSRGGPVLPGFRVISGHDAQVDFTSNATVQNGLRSLVLSRTLSRGEFGQLESDLRVEGSDGIVRGTVRNATPYTLDQVGLVVGQSIAKLGPMAPGQTSSVMLDPRTPPPMARARFPTRLHGSSWASRPPARARAAPRRRHWTCRTILRRAVGCASSTPSSHPVTAARRWPTTAVPYPARGPAPATDAHRAQQRQHWR